MGPVVAQLDVPPRQPTPITLREADADPDVCGRVLEGYRDHRDVRPQHGRADRRVGHQGSKSAAVNDSATVVGMLVEGTMATPPDLATQELRAWSGGHPVGDGPSPVGAPVLVIGSDDHFVFVGMIHDVIATRFADVEVTPVRDGGHWPHVEQPGATAAVLDDFIHTVSVTDGTNQS